MDQRMPVPQFDACFLYDGSDEEWVRRLARDLGDRLTVWHRGGTIHAAYGNLQHVEQALISSRNVVVVLSRTSVKSTWVRSEIEHALKPPPDEELPRRIVCVRRDDVQPPELLRDRLVIDCFPEGSTAPADRLISVIRSDGTPSPPPTDPGQNLPGIIRSASNRLIIIGHTLDKFSSAESCGAIFDAVIRGVHVTLVLANPYAKAAGSYDHERLLHDRPTTRDELNHSLDVLGSLSDALRREHAISRNLEVLLSNHVPGYRTMLVDDARCYVNLYMFGKDVLHTPRFAIGNDSEQSAQWLAAMRQSVHELLHTADIVAFIKDGQRDAQWRKRHVARFDSWATDTKRRFLSTTRYYSSILRDPRASSIDPSVRAYLDRFSGRILEVGCGEGETLAYLKRRAVEVYGLDFSRPTVERARRKNPELAARIWHDDVYDLHLRAEGEFDGIVADACLVHLLEREHLTKLLRRFARKLKPSGLCFVRMLDREGSQDGRCDDYCSLDQPADPPRWFRYFSRAALETAACRAGLRVVNEADALAARAAGTTVAALRDPGVPHRTSAGRYWVMALFEKGDR